MAEPGMLTGGKMNAEVEGALNEALRTIRFGTVTLVIQDGRVIQIERNEKFRMTRGEQHGSGI